MAGLDLRQCQASLRFVNTSPKQPPADGVFGALRAMTAQGLVEVKPHTFDGVALGPHNSQRPSFLSPITSLSDGFAVLFFFSPKILPPRGPGGSCLWCPPPGVQDGSFAEVGGAKRSRMQAPRRHLPFFCLFFFDLSAVPRAVVSSQVPFAL